MQCAQLTLSGGKAVASNNRLTTVAYQLNGARTYALEGAIFIAGVGVQWLRDGLKIVKNAAETGALARAALEAVCYQTNDLLEAMKKDWGASGTTILRDGGMTASDWTMQFLADILGAPVDRPKVLETTAIGAAYLAGLQAGLLPEPDVFAKTWKRDKRFVPKMDAETRSEKLGGWNEAVRKLLA